VLYRNGQAQRPSKITAILTYRGLERAEADSAEAGDIVAVAGLEGVGIGDTITDPADPRPLEPLAIEEPTIRMTFAVNTSPFAGKEGKYVTSRVLRDRLSKELETNVSLRVEETGSPDTYLVAGRGELHLAVLIEQMRREGFELQVSQPEVILHEKDGVRLEPYEFLVAEVPAGHQGTLIEEIGRRGGVLKHMGQAPTGEMHFEYDIPTRGVIGLRGALMTKTRGTAIVHHMFEEYRPLDGQAPASAPHGSLVAVETGESNAYGLNNVQERGELFIGPGVPVYQGMIIGENSRPEDLDISPCKTKKLTNMRSSGSDEAIILAPPRPMTLELAIEYIGPDELVEVTPKSIRLRKKVLDPLARKRLRRKES
jgi:GTP-binding protein